MTPGAYLWLGLAGLLLALVCVAFAYLGVRRLGRAGAFGRVLYDGLRRLDGWLRDAAPRTHRALRRRLSLRDWHGLALTLAAALLFGLVWLFSLIAVGWTSEEDLYQIDQVVHERLAEGLSSATVDFFRLATHLGDGLTVGVIGVALIVFLWRRGDHWMLAALVAAARLGQAVLLGLKWTFARARPGGKLIEAGFYSFPSGHSFSSMVLYGFLIVLAWRYLQSEAARIAVTIALMLTVVTTGLSRIVLSVHWTSDVLGGFTLGLAWLVVALTGTRAWQAYHRRRRVS